MGGGPAFANNETAQCAGQGVLNIQCCVGPDPVYQQGFRWGGGREEQGMDTEGAGCMRRKGENCGVMVCEWSRSRKALADCSG